MFPPVPPFPQLPYPLPYGIEIPEGHILGLPPEKDSCVCCVKEFLDCLKKYAHSWEGCDWVIQLNKKVYLILWRDKLPRGPWTRQVWDIFRLNPPSCGCPSAPTHLGWQWCWDTVVDTIAKDIFCHWVGDAAHGGGHTHTLVGTQLFQEGGTLPQIGPILHLDAADEDSFVFNGNLVARWLDKSTKENHAIQDDAAFQPAFVPNVLQGYGVVSFTGAEFLEILLKKNSGWHLFLVGRYFADVDQGTFFAATGVESPYSGFEAKIFQAAGAYPQGTMSTYVDPGVYGFQTNTVAPSSFAVMEWVQSSTSIRMAKDAFRQDILTSDLSQDVLWDPTALVGPLASPLKAAVGRSPWGATGNPWDYLTGEIAEVVLYPGPLAEGQRIQILNVLREKWGLGAPLAFPWEVA